MLRRSITQASLAARLSLFETTGAPIAAEATLRSSFFPNEKLADAELWRGNVRLVSRLRTAYLHSLPEAERILPEARTERLRRLNNIQSAEPPTMAAAKALFGLHHPTGAERQPALPRAMERAAAEC